MDTKVPSQDLLNLLEKFPLPRPGDLDWDAVNSDTAYTRKTCSKPTLYSETWDAYYCKECNIWNEEACGSPDCEFCANRPTNPN